MKKLLVCQGYIPEYRRPVFNALGDYYNVTVLHAGKYQRNRNDAFIDVSVPSSLIGPFHVQKAISKFFSDADVILSMFDLRWPSILIQTMRAKKARRLVWGHRSSKRRVINFFRTLVAKNVDGLVQYSDAETESLIQSGIPKNKIFIASNTLRIDNHQDCSLSYKDLFLFVGRLQRRKRIDVLINSFFSAMKNLPLSINLCIIGTGEDELNLRSLVKSLGIAERVHFLGELRQDEELKTYFKRAISYVSPGPVGLGVLHAIAYGVPILTVSASGLHGPEFNHLRSNQNSVILSSFDELATEMIKLAADDAKKARALGFSAYAHYQKYGLFSNMLGGLVAAIEGDVSSRFCVANYLQ